MSKFKAVVFDWAGTTIDFGSFAPMGAFVEAFEHFGVTVTIDEARAPMGMAKRDHIETMISMPRVKEEWERVTGQTPGDAEIDAIYDVFVPLNEDVVGRYADLVPGFAQVIEFLRNNNIKIGSTTGYTRSIMQRVLPVAAAQGYEPDNLVCSDDLRETRPGPLGMYQCMIDLGVYPPQSIIKVDDTEPGIAEGVSAGCVTVGVALSGNYVGKSPEELARMDDAEIALLRTKAAKRLLDAGADHIIDTVADLPVLIKKLEAV